MLVPESGSLNVGSKGGALYASLLSLNPYWAQHPNLLP